MASHLGRYIGSAPHGHHVDDFNVFHIGTALHQRFDQRFRFRATRLDVYAHARLHASQRFMRGAQLFLYSISHDIACILLSDISLVSCSYPIAA